MTDSLDTLAQLLRSRERFVLTTHVNPDGDGIGSEVALATWLENVGKKAWIINHSPTPEVYRFLDPRNRILTFQPDRDRQIFARAEAIFVLDTNQPDRLQSMESPVLASSAVKVCIDHHLEPHPFAQHYLIDADATSTGEILYRLLVRIDPSSLSPPVAEALYCAIMTDTGSFRYPRVDPEIFRMAADLVERGADPVAIYTNVYERWSRGRIHLLGEMLAGLRTESGGRLAHVSVSREMLSRTGTTEEDTDNFTTFPMSVEGVVAGILFLELQDGIKISFRSKGNIGINELAKEFGGNGHLNAAGARVSNGTLADVRQRVLAAAVKYFPE